MKIFIYLTCSIILFISGAFLCENLNCMRLHDIYAGKKNISIKNKEIKMEKAPSPWANFLFDGPREEAPEAIEIMALSGKWIQPIDSSKENEYFLAYSAEVALKKHEKDKIHREGSYEWPILDYSVSFHFYFLDENGFCLKDIETSDENINSFPSFGGIFIEPGKEVDIQHTILKEFFSENLASRIRKIVYLPKFKTCALKILSEADTTDITKEKARLLQLWKKRIDELPPKTEWDIFHLVSFETYGGDKTDDELNEKAEEVAKQNLGIVEFNLNERINEEAPFGY